MILKYIFPYVYFFTSRLPRANRRLSWILIEPLPVFLTTYCLATIPFMKFFVLFLSGYTAYISIYEVGYIENDSITIGNEKQPALRLKDTEITFVLNNIKKIEFIRWSISLLILILSYFLGIKFKILIHFFPFCLLIVTIRIIYLFHNYLRNKLNIISLFLLSSSRYIGIPLLLLEAPTVITLSILLILIYPFPKTLEYAQMKYDFSFLRLIKTNQPLCRVIYYVILFSTALLFELLTKDKNIFIYMAISLFGYFLIYRFLIFSQKLT
jgi:hypothetical protein